MFKLFSRQEAPQEKVRLGLGIFVSEKDGKLDWAELKHNGVSFAFIQVSRGAKIDATFNNNYKSAMECGLPFGFVYEYDPSSVGQEEFFINLVKQSKPELPPVLYWTQSGKLDGAKVKPLLDKLTETAVPAIRAEVRCPAGFEKYLFMTEASGVLNPPIQKPWSTWDYWVFKGTLGLNKKFDLMWRKLDAQHSPLNK